LYSFLLIVVEYLGIRILRTNLIFSTGFDTYNNKVVSFFILNPIFIYFGPDSPCNALMGINKFAIGETQNEINIMNNATKEFVQEANKSLPCQSCMTRKESVSVLLVHVDSSTTFFLFFGTKSVKFKSFLFKIGSSE
jgi:hypothetical protein